jgi:D-alanine-D-alanine ligase-like ATP-grasp enzyme
VSRAEGLTQSEKTTIVEGHMSFHILDLRHKYVGQCAGATQLLESARSRCSLLIFRAIHVLKRILGALQRIAYPRRARTPKSPLHNRLVLSAAREMNLRVDELPYQMLRISDGERLVYSTDFNFSFESLTAYWLCGNKHLTSALLRERGILVPDFAVYHAKDLASAFSAFPTLRHPVVVKPCFGAGGEGITVGVTTLQEFRRACYRAALTAEPIIVEQMVTGRHWRVTLFDGQLVFACERLPAFVVGDGQSSIEALVSRRNAAIAERAGFSSAYPIHVDEDTRAALRDQNMTPESVPAAAQRVVLKRICNAAVGGLTVDISASLHDDYLDLARQAAAAMGARLAGVDIIGPDATQPIDSGDVFVNEVNTTPDLLLNHFDVSGSGNAIASVGRLLKMVFAAGPSATLSCIGDKRGGLEVRHAG